MNRLCSQPPLRRSVLAVRCALGVISALGLGAQAQTAPDPKLVELTQPRSSVEIGVAVRDGYAAKAAEYSGVTNKNPSAIGRLELYGGGTYDSTDSTRWRVLGENLGLRSRSIEADGGVQGQFRVRLGYDELQRNQSDSFQTPYQGVGSNQLTLPSGWLVPVVPRVSATAPNARGLSSEVTASNAIVGGVSTPPTAAQAAAAAAVQAADLPAFGKVDLFTRRTRTSAAVDFELGGHWTLSGSLTNEHKQGLKPLGAQSRATNGDTSSILPVPVDEDDRRLAAGLRYTGDAAQFQVGYEGSSFVNHVPSVSWSLWAAPTITATMAAAPSNTWHKLSVSGAMQFGSGTRVLASASRGRSAQNDALLSDTTALVVPVASAQALVVNDAASLKLLHQPAKGWHLMAGYKYELRDNRTPINTFGYYDNNNAPTGASPFAYLFPSLTAAGQNLNFNANQPYSRRVNQLSAEAEYRGLAGHNVKLGLEGQNTDRWCNGSWYACANARSSRETTLRGEWRATPLPELSTRLALSAASRKVAYDENAFLAGVPMANQSPSTATDALAGSSVYSTLVALGLTGYGPVQGRLPAAAAGSALAFYFPLNNVANNLLYGNENRISELLGMRRWNQADRERQTLRSSAQWQAAEALTLQAGIDASADHYSHSTYGLQRATQVAVNLDAAWAPGEDQSLNVFASHELQRSRSAGNTYTANSAATTVNGATAIDGGCFATIALRNSSNKVDPCLDWQSTQRDTTTTLGAAYTRSGLWGGALALTGSAAFSRARTAVGSTGGNYVNNPFAGVAGNATAATAAFFVPGSPLPVVTADSVQLQLAGTYRLDKAAALRVSCGLQRLTSSDWAYEGQQDGGLTQVLPTREQAPQYRIHSLGVAYVLAF